jgi:hypothetical protein
MKTYWLFEYGKRKGGGMKQCNTCKSWLDLHCYHDSARGKSGKHSQCIRCKGSKNAAAYKRGMTYLINLVASHGCKDCGERDYRKLEFDHLSIKNFSPFNEANRPISSLDAEIALCEVVCCNCHQLRTLQRANSYRWRLWQSEHEQHQNDAICAEAA